MVGWFAGHGIPISGNFSAATANALELGVEELFSLLRRGLDVIVVTAAAPAAKFGPVCAALAKSVTAARFGRQRLREQNGHPEGHGHDGRSCHAPFKQWLLSGHRRTVGVLKGEIGASRAGSDEVTALVRALVAGTSRPFGGID